MLTQERRNLILSVLKRDGRILAKPLSRELGLSEDTIRRDLRELAGAGLLQRVHGGALPASPATADMAARGRLFRHSMVAVGAAALEAILRVRADIFFLGVTGVHPEAGLTTGDAEEAAMKRTLAGQASDTYVLASAEKIGAVSPYKVLGLRAITAILTDAHDDALHALRRTAPAIIECG